MSVLRWSLRVCFHATHRVTTFVAEVWAEAARASYKRRLARGWFTELGSKLTPPAWRARRNPDCPFGGCLPD